MFAFIPLQLKQPGVKNTIPVANAALVAITVLVFCFGFCDGWVVGRGTGLLSILTYGFAHVSTSHLIANMWVLLVFGNPVNRRIGNGYYLLAYLGSIVALGLFAKLFLGAALMGASGAVFAVITIALILMPSALLEVAYLALFPVTLIVGLLSKPAHWVYWFIRLGTFSFRAIWCLLLIPAMQLWSFFWSGWSISCLAHLLGMACGIAVVLMLPTRITMRHRAAVDF